MITSHDVAKLAGVSQATVSRAFREDCYINPQTKKKVLDAANELGYFPNLSAKGLKSNRSGVIGLILANYDNRFYTSVTKALEAQMNVHGYRFMIAFSDEDPQKERRYLESFISTRVDGIILAPISKGNSDIVKSAESFGIPVLQFTNRLFPDVSSYCVDDEYGMYVAAKHLLNMGHRRILMVDSADRFSVKSRGFRKAMEEFSCFSDGCIVSCNSKGDMTSPIIFSIGDYKPTAIIGSNSLITVAALRSCRRLGISVPDDMSFIAYDDNEWLDFMHIDAVGHPMEEIGRGLSDTMLELINGQGTVNRLVSPFLVARNSVKRLIH